MEGLGGFPGAFKEGSRDGFSTCHGAQEGSMVPAGVPGRFQDPPGDSWWFLVDSMIPFVASEMFEGSTNRSVAPSTKSVMRPAV